MRDKNILQSYQRLIDMKEKKVKCKKKYYRKKEKRQVKKEILAYLYKG